MIINLEFDAQAQAAPQSFRDAVQKAADIIDQTLTDSITVNIEVGYGELTKVNGTSEPLGAGLSEGGATLLGTFYGVMTGIWLDRAADPEVDGAISRLPASDPVAGNTFFGVPQAELDALNDNIVAGSALEGAVGFSSTIPAADLVAAALHELTHALGRLNGDADIFDLYRFTSPGVNLFASGSTAPAAYFSLDGGVTDLADYGQTSDPADFIKNGALTPHDALNESTGPNSYTSLSTVDVLQMEALGYHGAVDAQPLMVSNGGGAQVAAVVYNNQLMYDWGYMAAGPNGDVWHDLGNDAFEDVVGKADFNGDGVMDIALRDKQTGELSYDALNASGTVAGIHDVGPTSLDYTSLGAGDFNGDGIRDIAFRDVSTGAWGFMTVNRGGGETWHGVGPSSTAYAAVGIGDFNGDGAADIAFRNPATGDFGFMSANPGGGETWHPAGPTSPDYAVIGFGDFNGDGISDVAFRNMTTGDWGYMSIDPGGGETWHAVGPTSIGYAAVGSGDYNGDGVSDVAFRDMATGDWGYMSANPAGGEVWHSVGPTSTAYFAV